MKFTDGDKVVATATTYGNGKYSALMPAGTWTITVSKTDYISYKAEIIVISAIAAGGAGDAALSKVLAEGEWRVTLTWAAHSEDLDSHTHWEKIQNNWCIGKTERKLTLLRKCLQYSTVMMSLALVLKPQIGRAHV